MLHPRRSHLLTQLPPLVACALTPLTIACTDFPDEPRSSVVVGQDSWPTEMLVEDTDTLAITVTLPTSTVVTGLQAEWKSGSPEVLDLVELAPVHQTREDSLTSQLRAVAHASARGAVQLTVTIEGVGGFVATDYSAGIVVKERWRAISAGQNHTCAINVHQEAYCWGSGSNGALGNGEPGGSLVPAPVFLIGGPKFASISAGEQNTCATIVQNIAYCWGSGTLGRLGTGSESDQFVPTPVSLGRTWEATSAGQTTCGITSASELFCWGSNSDLQLGAPKTGLGFDACGSVECSLIPLAVRSASGDTLFFSAVDVGTFHACGISSASARAFCWGRGFDSPILDTVFVLGDSTFESQTPTPVAASAVSGQALSFQALSVGLRHTCGVTTGGEVYCWGINMHGELGVGETPSISADPVAAGSGLQFASITAGGTHTCGLASSGQAHCWGANEFGQLGTDSSPISARLQPTPVAGGHVFQSITAGDAHTCGIISTGAAYCWGVNTSGQLGTTVALQTCPVPGGTTSCALVPTRVSEPVD